MYLVFVTIKDINVSMIFTAIGDMELMYLVIVLMCGVTYSGEYYICVIRRSIVLLMESYF